jgi:ribonuclease Y
VRGRGGLRWLLRPVVPAADAAKERELERREADLGAARDRLARATADAEAARREADAAASEARARLAEAAGFSPAEAKAKALEVLDRELATEHARRVAAHVEAVRGDAEARARALVATAIQRVAVSHAAERTVTSVPLPDDGMKGRVIGREGRNARAFEHATGCDVVVDDTPGLVTLSGFDPVRREVARRAMTALVADGRIHPVRIEEAVAEARRGLEDELVEVGRKALVTADVGDAHPRVVALLGRLQYRTSYGQNVLQHALEVAHLCGAMASGLRLDPRVARRAELLRPREAVDHRSRAGTRPSARTWRGSAASRP